MLISRRQCFLLPFALPSQHTFHRKRQKPPFNGGFLFFSFFCKESRECRYYRALWYTHGGCRRWMRMKGFFTLFPSTLSHFSSVALFLLALFIIATYEKPSDNQRPFVLAALTAQHDSRRRRRGRRLVFSPVYRSCPKGKKRERGKRPRFSAPAPFSSPRMLLGPRPGPL